MRHLLLFLLLLLPSAGSVAQPASNTKFASIAFHDVVDSRADRSEDAVTTQSLIEFFDWLLAEGWKPVSLDAIEAAGRGGKPLPEKAILLTFDDGYTSFRDRVYPLLLAYDYPAVLAVVGSWMDVPADGIVDYGGTKVPRAHFVSWADVRRMQASGLVEIASHSYDLHTVVRSTPQGNSAPSARTWAYDPATGVRETDTQHRGRIHADLARSAMRITQETGKPPRALVWPFGRFSGPALEEAKAAGYAFALTLEPEIADAREPFALHRYYPTRDPGLGILAYNLGFAAPRAPTVRLACADIAPMAALSGDAQDALLGKMIEDVRALGATAVILDVAPASEGALVSSWFPTPLLPMSADIFGRIARQLGSRGGVSVYARLPLDSAAAAVGEANLAALAGDIARAAPIDGFVMQGSGVATPASDGQTVTQIRTVREGANTRAAAIMAGAAAIDPRLRLLMSAPAPAVSGPAPDTDRLLLPAGVDPQALAASGWLQPATSGRVVVGLSDAGARKQRREIRAFQRAGATALALCPWKAGDSLLLAPAFSAAIFPYRP